MALDINFDKQVARISPLTKKGFFGRMVGEYRSAFRGRGLEFSGFRAYDSYDDAIRIDWKASLRSSDLLVRLFEEERNLTILFLFDTSNTMLFASTDKLKAEYAAEFIGALAYGVLKADDAVGLIMFNDDIRSFLPSQIGDRQYFDICKQLKNDAAYGGGKDFEKIIKFAMSALPQTTIIFLVSDFIGLPEDDSLIQSFLQKFEVVGCMIRDPHDDTLPDVGLVSMADPISGDDLLADTSKLKERYEENARLQRERVRTLFRKGRDDLIELSTTDDFLNIVFHFFKRRQGVKQVV